MTVTNAALALESAVPIHEKFVCVQTFVCIWVPRLSILIACLCKYAAYLFLWATKLNWTSIIWIFKIGVWVKRNAAWHNGYIASLTCYWFVISLKPYQMLPLFPHRLVLIGASKGFECDLTFYYSRQRTKLPLLISPYTMVLLSKSGCCV